MLPVIFFPKPRSKYGWLKDPLDKRDLLFSKYHPSIPIPEKIDLRPYCSVVENQGNLGSCTAQALVGALEVLEVKKWKKYIDLSRLFVYYNERALIGTILEDSGAYIRDGIKTLVRDGVCLEKLWPYNIAKFTKKPCDQAWTEAKLHKIVRYHRLQTLNDMLTCLAEGYPFTFGFSVYDSFESEVVSRTGIVPMPDVNKEELLGGHAVLAVGYDLKKKMFLVRNSWGSSWGLAGYFWMPFDFLTDIDLASDFWSIYSANV